ncbi:MAG: hypothetical protein N3D11_16495 [Candidatus Sumerlaeia bacterium]|nr:hypothetical protein [Candidatus Sumerlaeia bacterium]
MQKPRTKVVFLDHCTGKDALKANGENIIGALPCATFEGANANKTAHCILCGVSHLDSKDP